MLISILLFGAIHYNGNLAQMFLLIGPARFFLTGAFIRSKNILIPFTMHYLFDQIGFTIIFLVEVLS
ncbi:type II CAAX prenyl endopeptidase Rce1 family protein [Paucilactobacillus nenjiangensis]|uniref:CPBP family glutamic-type intramembrane protease n=1 Tax=Paucilactobacillus nenjiangensis TaxID=1296540 RepID=UPI0028D28BE7|nr:CPBP family glutamic-type intramembrane protease [Paucilactobacillus nenjiangensis]